MSTMNDTPVPGSTEDRGGRRDESVSELLLLLPGWQVAELERLAHSRGLTTGQLVRLLIRDYLTLVGGYLPWSPNSKGEGR
jgi:hypothetical protein